MAAKSSSARGHRHPGRGRHAAADLGRGVRPRRLRVAGGRPDAGARCAATSEAAQRIWELVDRANLLFKIPGTQEGLRAIEDSIARGISVNVTLLFSLERHAEVS